MALMLVEDAGRAAGLAPLDRHAVASDSDMVISASIAVEKGIVGGSSDGE